MGSGEGMGIGVVLAVVFVVDVVWVIGNVSGFG